MQLNYDMCLYNINNIIYKVTDTLEFKLYQGTKENCIKYILNNSQFKFFQDNT